MYIYGKNVSRECLNSDDVIARAFVSKKFRDQDIIDKLRFKGVRINFVDNRVLDNKVDGLHQGIVLEVDDVNTYDINSFIDSIKDVHNPRVVMLDHLEDPHNFGAIIRTCEALGVEGIIIPRDRSVGVNATVVKTSAGAISYVKIVKVSNLQVALKKLRDHNFWIVGTDMKGDDYTKIDYNMPVVLVIGNEGHGISSVVRKECDFIASIPMKGHVNSLNASVSCGIVLSRIVGSNNNG